MCLDIPSHGVGPCLNTSKNADFHDKMQIQEAFIIALASDIDENVS